MNLQLLYRLSILSRDTIFCIRKFQCKRKFDKKTILTLKTHRVCIEYSAHEAVRLNRIAGDAWRGVGDCPALAKQAVVERRFPHVWPPCQHHRGQVAVFFCYVEFFFFINVVRLKHCLSSMFALRREFPQWTCNAGLGLQVFCRIQICFCLF